MTDWVQLPSGFVMNFGNDTFGGVTRLSDHLCWWWIKRRDRILIEGPVTTVELAKSEVIKEAGEVL